MTKLLGSILLLSLVACGGSGGDNRKSVLENGRIPNDNGIMKIGKGYNALTDNVVNTCLELPATLPSGTNAQTTTFTLTKIETYSELRKNLQISASGSYKAGFVGGSAKINYYNNLEMNDFYSYLFVSVNVENETVSLDDVKLTPAVATLFATDKKAFLDRCGTEAIVGKTTGGEFTAVVEFKAKSQEEKTSLDAKIKASGGAWKVSGSFKQAIESISSSSEVSVKMFRQGGSGDLPSIESLTDAALKFPSQVTAEASPWVTMWHTQTYESIAGSDAMKLREQREALEDSLNFVEQARSKKGTLNYILLNAEEFELTGESTEKLKKDQKDLTEIINLYTKQANKCFDNFNDCSWPPVTIPDVRTPDRFQPLKATFATDSWTFGFPFGDGVRYGLRENFGPEGNLWFSTYLESINKKQEMIPFEFMFFESPCNDWFENELVPANISMWSDSGLKFYAGKIVRPYHVPSINKRMVFYNFYYKSNNKCAVLDVYQQNYSEEEFDIEDHSDAAKLVKKIVKSVKLK